MKHFFFFVLACSKVIQQRYGFSTSTLSSNRSITPQQPSPMSNPMRILANTQSVPPPSHLPGNINLTQTAPASVFSSYHYDQQPPILSPPNQNFAIAQLAQCLNTQTINGVLKDRNNQQQMQLDKRTRSFKDQQSGMKLSTLSETHSLPVHDGQIKIDANEQQITPTSTPTQKRKDTKRKSNIFTPGRKDEEKNKVDRLGHGRAIPIKQGFLYKKGTNSINRDWKKKYVVLLDDGRIIYHPSLHDYENDSHGKEIILQRTTIKIPGSNKPRVALRSANNDPKSNDNLPFDLSGKIETPNSKKRHRRPQQLSGLNHVNNSSKSMSNNNGGDDDGDENIFIIVSLDKQWFFEAQSNEERDEWVQAIEQQILFSLQNIESSKAARAAKIGGPTIADSASVQAIKQIPGNGFCADCDQINPTWASLNLGALICMDCASLHRNLGTHLSRVRSLELDEWP